MQPGPRGPVHRRRLLGEAPRRALRQYRTADPAEAELTRRRMLAEQKPHVVVTFPRGEQSAERLAAAAARAGVAVEAVDAAGRNHTRTGELADLQKARQGREHAEPNPAWVVPVEGRTAAETNKRLGQRAADAAWAKPGHAPEEPPPTLNLRDRSAFDAVRDGTAVRIDRKTDWGNPFPLRDRDDPHERREVLEQYRSYLADAIDSGKVDLDRLARLDGKQLLPLRPAGLPRRRALRGRELGRRHRTRPRTRGSAGARADAGPARTRRRRPADTHVFDPGGDDWDEAPPPDERPPAERPPANRPELQHPDDLAADPARGLPREDRRGRRERETARGDRRRHRDAARQRRTRPHRAARRRRPAHAAADAAAARRLQPQPGARAPTSPTALSGGRRSRPCRPRRRRGPRADARSAGAGHRLLEPRQPPRRLRQARRDPPAHRAPRCGWSPGDSRGAQSSPPSGRARAGVPCDVHPTDWDGARAQYEADAARAENYDAELAAINAQYPPDADHAVPDPDDPGAARNPRREALDELESAVEWHEQGEKAYRREAVRCRDEYMLDNGKPHLAVSFETGNDRGGKDVIAMASDRGVPCERVDRHGTTLTLADQRPDLRAIGRRASRYAPRHPAAGAGAGRRRAAAQRGTATVFRPHLRDGDKMIRQMDLKDHPHTGVGRTVDPDTPKYEQLCELLTDDGHLLAELGDPITGHLLWLAAERIDDFGLPADTAAAVYWTNGCDEAGSGQPQWRVQALTPLEAVRILTETMSTALDHVLARCDPEASTDHPVRHLLALDASRRNVVSVLQTLAAR